MKDLRVTLTMTAAVVATAALATMSADWPQWRGPNRTGVSAETGLLTQWPSGGPAVAWTAQNLGGGYGSLSVAGDKVFVQGLRNRQSIVSALSAADGRGLWSKTLGAGGSNDRGDGPRSTPTVDGDRLYVLTENGDLACLKHDGTMVWQKNILKEFAGRNIPWLLSESPLIDGEHVIVSPGGRGASVVALNKMTGALVWKSAELSDEAGYASAIVADVQGVRTIMTYTSEAGVGLRASDGKLLWKERSPANSTANIATPIFFDNKVFYSSAYGTGAVLLGLRADNGLVRAQQVYFTRDMQNHHGGVVLIDGYLYGFNNAILTCLEFATGKMMWRHRSVGKGAVTAANGHLYILGEDHVVGLVEATPAGYREKGRFQIKDLGLPAWAHPVVSGGRLYLRNQNTLTAYTVAAR
jgi:outer membrane protein assembly factor BamB